MAGAGSEGTAGNKHSPKRGWGGAGEQGWEQKGPQTWPGLSQRAGPGTKTALNVAGTESESRSGNKNGPKRGRDGVGRQSREQKRP